MKRKMFIVSMILSFMFMATSVDVFAMDIKQNNDMVKEIVHEDVYQISTADDLLEFATKVNTDDGSNTYNAILVNNIDLKDVNYSSIGNDQHPYTGVFDGNGKEILNLHMNSSSSNTGLFGYLTGATIKNLTVRGEVASSADFCGGIFGYAKDSMIENCINYATIKGSASGNGGIGGKAENTTIIRCINNGQVMLGIYQNGGIAGHLNGGTIDQCINNGEISVKDHAGGIVGWMESGTIQNCGNVANVKNTNSFYTYVGGIAGECRGVIQNCFNTGKVSGASGTGCYQASIAAHYDRGGNGNTNYSSQVQGSGDNGTIKDASAFSNGEIAWLLNNEKPGGVWCQTLTGSDAQNFPNFSGEKIYKLENSFSNICDHKGNTNSPTCGEDANCSICGEIIAATGLHIYDQEIADTSYLKNLADCTHAATYYISCVCGASSQGTPSEQVFTVGNEKGHQYSSFWSLDEVNHWHECICGDKIDVAIHQPKTMNAIEATTTDNGYTGDIICEICGYEMKKGEVILKDTTSDNEKPIIPQTGDYNHVLLWFIIMFIGMNFSIMTFFRKRKMNKSL